jgi:hypothetical protein
MQIPPSNALLQALSRHPDPASAPRPKTTNPDAAREAARAIFAQIKAAPKPATPAVQAFAPAQPAAQAQGFTPNPTAAIPALAPTKPLPRGSFLNILV